MSKPYRSVSQPLEVTRDGLSIPTLAWLPDGEFKAVVLVCHGGSGHKQSPAVLAIVAEFLPLGIAVLAIDGPVHGERRADGDLDPHVAKESFRKAWRTGVGHTDMARDLSAALDRFLVEGRHHELPVGYIGVSMGTAYGLPFLAEDPRVTAAVIGLWGSTYPASGHLLEYASRVRCSVWFTQQWNDEFFDRAGTADLFDKIGSVDKQLVAYPGPHMELQGRRLKDAVAFLVDRLIQA